MKRSIAVVASVTLSASLVALKVAAMLYARHCGFAQVSDDDYARVVIAQTFVHAPHLDPSGTSWLPFPFWLYGIVMMIAGRSLEVARALAFGLGALSAILPYVALRSMQSARFGAWVGAALAALTPWSVWLGLAPVPEVWAAACAASALFFVAVPNARHAVIASVLVLVATLSRYESWPLAALVAGVCVARARKFPAQRVMCGVASVIASLGPLAWLANNAIAHGDVFHFVARVAAFRRANAGSMPMGARIIEYPLALVHDAPEIVIAAIVGALVVARAARAGLASGHRASFVPWSIPLGGAALVLAFLIYGDVRDGAPTHHAARALLPVMFVLAGFAGAAFDEIARQGLGRIALAMLAMIWLAFVGVRVRDTPGNGDARREAQIARGRALANEPHLDITPCTYEHFALIAAYGAPERVTIEPLTHEPVTPTCPHVTFLASDALR